MNAEPILESFNIDTKSTGTAVQQVREMIQGSDNPMGAARALFTSLVNPDHEFNFVDTTEARLTVACLVVDAIQLGVKYEPNAALVRAAEWITRQRKENPWFFTKPDETDDTLEDRGGVKVSVKADGSLKKGSKQVLAQALFNNNPTLNNAQLIDLFVKELDMSTAGARTYVYNCRKAAVVGK